MNRFQRGMMRLIDRMGAPEGAAVEVTYTRAAGGTETLTGVWLGRTGFRRNASDSVAGLVFSDADFMIPVSAIAYEPVEGDVITYGAFAFRVSAPDGEPAVRYSDQTRMLWRVHAKIIAA